MDYWITDPRDLLIVGGMVAFIALAFSVIVAFILYNKGRSPLLGFVLGLLLGPIGLFIGMALPAKQVQNNT